VFPIISSSSKFSSYSTLLFEEYSSKAIETFTKKGNELSKSFLLIQLLLPFPLIEQLDETSNFDLFFPLPFTPINSSSELNL
jgi:hypothetical protein